MFTSVASDRSNSCASEPQIKLSIARSRSELVDAFRLVHLAYVRAGLQEPNVLGVRLTPYHLLPTTEVLTARLRGETISTASLIVDGEEGLPAESIYAQEIDEIRQRGMRLAEVGCFADRRASPVRFMQLFGRLSKLIAQAAAARSCDGLIAATHPRHARFYIRRFGFQQVGGLRDCPYVKGNPAVALLMDFEGLKGTQYHEKLFQQEYPAAELAPYVWCESTKAYFEKLMRQLEGPCHDPPKPPPIGPTFNIPAPTQQDSHQR